ncbi:universal stress protein [Actinoplanes sp. GCM10030250]|uniref:universal stress protein n=1 Tax=Actinoplanes sp. GCM10030250 TaxID=3273376 RepID=UPI0036200677
MHQDPGQRVSSLPIVVGVDGSPGSKAALRWALPQADRTGATVDAVSVWTPTPASFYAYAWTVLPQVDDDVADATEKALLDTLVEVTTEYGRSAPIRPRLMRGRPAQELVRASRSAQLLVLGGPAHGPMAGLLLGSVSHQCLQAAACPVLVVPAGPVPFAAGTEGRAGGVVPAGGGSP